MQNKLPEKKKKKKIKHKLRTNKGPLTKITLSRLMDFVQ